MFHDFPRKLLKSFAPNHGVTGLRPHLRPGADWDWAFFSGLLMCGSLQLRAESTRKKTCCPRSRGFTSQTQTRPCLDLSGTARFLGMVSGCLVFVCHSHWDAWDILGWGMMWGMCRSSSPKSRASGSTQPTTARSSRSFMTSCTATSERGDQTRKKWMEGPSPSHFLCKRSQASHFGITS